MKRKVVWGITVMLLLSITFSLAEGKVFDLRTHKNLSSPIGIAFDNVPHLYESHQGKKYGYSGIFVGDSIKVSGETEKDANIEIVFPSGKIVKITPSDGYFEKEITFDEEGNYSVKLVSKNSGKQLNEESFNVSYRAIPIAPTLQVKDIINGMLRTNDWSARESINWNHACAAEDGKNGTAHLLIVKSNGEPLANFKGKQFTTDKFGIAKIPFSSKSIKIYGDIRAVRYDKLVFDRNGKLIYSSVPQKIDAFVNEKTFYLNEKEFFSYVFKEAAKNEKDIMIENNSGVKFSNVEIGKNYIFEPVSKVAIPAKITEKNGQTYVNAESLLALISYPPSEDFNFGIAGTSMRYYPDRIEIYIIERN